MGVWRYQRCFCGYMKPLWVLATWMALSCPWNSVFAQSLGTISGRVTDVRDGSPVEGAILRLGRDGVFGGFEPDNTIAAEATNADGHFHFSAVPSRDYSLMIEPPAPFLPRVWPNYPCSSIWSCSAPSTGNIVVANGSTLVVDAEVEPPGKIVGRAIAQASGAAIPDAIVTAVWKGSVGGMSRSALTDASGGYEIADLPSGPYALRFVAGSNFLNVVYADVPCAPDCNTNSPGRTLVHVPVGAEVTGIDFALLSGQIIAGVVSDPLEPVHTPHVILRLHRLENGAATLWRQFTYWGELGEFWFSGLVPGAYMLSTGGLASSPVYVGEVFDDQTCADSFCTQEEILQGVPILVSEGEIRNDIQMELDAAGSLSGCLRDTAGTPLPGITVIAYFTGATSVTMPEVISTRSDEQGCYRVNYLPQNTFMRWYRIRTVNQLGLEDRIFPDAPCVGTQCNLMSGQALDLGWDEDIGDVDMVLSQGLTIAGHIRAYPGGPSVKVDQFEVRTASGSLVRSHDWRHIVGGEDGGFRTVALAVGAYRLTALVYFGPYAGTYQLGAPTRPGAPTLPLEAGQVIEVLPGKNSEGLEFNLTEVDIFASGFE